MLYSHHTPTAFDNHISIEDRENWLVAPCTRNRDSDVFTRANFEAQLSWLNKKNCEFEVHSFGHWACGWYEIVLVHPSHAEIVEEIEGSIEDYPVLDEDLYSSMQYNEAQDLWYNMSVRGRIALVANAGMSIFSARSAYVPSEVLSDLVP